VQSDTVQFGKGDRRRHEPWCNEDGAQRCDGITVAVNGDVGTMVETVQRQILRYYTDVGNQATESFESAKRISKWGFILVAVTIGYGVSGLLLPASAFTAVSRRL
jgi:hypothetical protein